MFWTPIADDTPMHWLAARGPFSAGRSTRLHICVADSSCCRADSCTPWRTRPNSIPNRLLCTTPRHTFTHWSSYWKRKPMNTAKWRHAICSACQFYSAFLFKNAQNERQMSGGNMVQNCLKSACRWSSVLCKATLNSNAWPEDSRKHKFGVGVDSQWRSQGGGGTPPPEIGFTKKSLAVPLS